MERKPQRRRGAAIVEFVFLVPLLAYLFVITVDWARIFYYSVTVTNCARNGAVYCSDPIAQAASPYSDVNQAALADAPNLSPTPTVTSASGTDSSGAYVEVTVSYPFRTLTNFPGVPSSTTLVHTIRTYVAQRTPN